MQCSVRCITSIVGAHPGPVAHSLAFQRRLKLSASHASSNRKYMFHAPS